LDAATEGREAGTPADVRAWTGNEPRAAMTRDSAFEREFRRLFDAHHPRLFRYLDRLSGEPDLANDLVQETFVRLYRRGSLPDSPEAWLITVAMNLFRNARVKRTRRRGLLTLARAQAVLADPPATDDAAGAADERVRVRVALERLRERERQLLLLHAEGYRYSEIATALDLNEASVGTLLARARRAFREVWEEASHAPR
jgi:RNA polymerase sigma-70 factor (ECF subfamily)